MNNLDIAVTLGIILGLYGISLFLFALHLWKKILVIETVSRLTYKEQSTYASRISLAVETSSSSNNRLRHDINQLKHSINSRVR